MFELENALRDWTARFRQTEAMQPADVEELEQHVRDSLAALTAGGLSEEEAFLVATHRVGPAAQLEGEFHKVNGNYVLTHRLLWMLAGYLLFVVSQLTVAAAAMLSQALTALMGGSGTMMACASISVTALCWLAFATWIYRYAGIEHQDRFTKRGASKPQGRVIGVGLAAALCALLVKSGSELAISIISPREEFSQAMFITVFSNAFFTLMLPIACLAIMFVIRVRMRETTVAA